MQWLLIVTNVLSRGTAPDSEGAYASAAKTKGFSPETVTLDDGTKAHWIGKPTAETVLLYLHGMLRTILLAVGKCIPLLL
jgi:hypothetical protein